MIAVGLDWKMAIGACVLGEISSVVLAVSLH